MCVCGHVQPWMGVYICTDVSACVYYVQYVAKRVLMSRSISTKSYIGMCILCTYIRTTTSHFMLLYKEVLLYCSKMLTLKT